MAWLAPPPRLMLATAGLTAFAVTQSMPAMTPELEPLPLHPSTLTPVIGAPGATPTTSLVLSLRRDRPRDVRAVTVAVAVRAAGEIDVADDVRGPGCVASIAGVDDVRR